MIEVAASHTVFFLLWLRYIISFWLVIVDAYTKLALTDPNEFLAPDTLSCGRYPLLVDTRSFLSSLPMLCMLWSPPCHHAWSSTLLKRPFAFIVALVRIGSTCLPMVYVDA